MEDTNKQQPTPTFAEAFPEVLKTLAKTSLFKEVHSSSTGNKYSLIGSIKGSRIGVAISFGVVETEGTPTLALIIRALEFPAVEGSYELADGENEREYLIAGEEVSVCMLEKIEVPFSVMGLAPWEVAEHLHKSKDNILDFVIKKLEASGVTLIEASTENLKLALFQRFDDLPSKPTETLLFKGFDLSEIKPY